jgi:hypothetical protein
MTNSGTKKNVRLFSGTLRLFTRFLYHSIMEESVCGHLAPRDVLIVTEQVIEKQDKIEIGSCLPPLPSRRRL